MGERIAYIRGYMNPDLTLPISLLTRTLVYGWRRGERYLYIGQTNALLRRMGTHHKVGKILDFEPTDNLDIWLVDAKDLLVVEEALIRLHQPLYNGDWMSRYSENIRKNKAKRRRLKTALKEEVDKIRRRPRLKIKLRLFKKVFGK